MSALKATGPQSEVGYVGKVRLFSRNAWLYLLFLFCYSTSFGIFLVALGLYVLRLGYDESLVGSIELAAMLLGAAICLPGGPLVDKFGAKHAMLGAAGLVALGRLGLAASTDSSVMIIAAMLLGAGMAIHWIASDVLLSGSSTERPLLFSLRFATFSSAMVVGSILGGILPGVFGVLLHIDGASPEAYRITLAVAAAISVLGTIPLFLVSNPPAINLSNRPPGLLGYRMRQPLLMAKMVLPQALLSMSMAAFFPFLSIFFRYHLGAATEQVGVVIAGGAIASTVAALLAPKLVDRIGKVRTVTFLQVVGFPFLLLTGYTQILGIAMVAFWLSRALVASSYPVMATFVMEIVDVDERGRASALMNLFWNIGWAISAWGAGMIMSFGHYSIPYLLSALLLALGSASWYGFLHKREPAPAIRWGDRKAEKV